MTKYSLISMVNILLGLGVTVLVWFQYSATVSSDVILLSISLIGTLSQLALVGVEQVLYFYSDERGRGKENGYHFYHLSLVWALLSGFIFIILFLALSRLFLTLVAPGLSTVGSDMTLQLLRNLSPALILSPCLHVLRAKWALDEAFGRAYLLAAVQSGVIFASLLASIGFFNGDIFIFGKTAMIMFLILLGIFIVYHRKQLFIPRPEDFFKLKKLMIASFGIKGANAVHNFLIQALMTSILSKLGPGALSIYQYAKKLADGVFAITAGPQVMIYHSKCAQAISKKSITDIYKSARIYLRSFLPLFFMFGLVTYLLTPLALKIAGQNFSDAIIIDIQRVFVGNVIWYLIMGIETLAVGVLLATHSSLGLFGVNFTFISIYYIYTERHIINTPQELIFITASFQIVSFSLFYLTAYLLLKKRRMFAR